MKIPALIAALGLVALAAGLLLRRNTLLLDGGPALLDDSRSESDDLRCKRSTFLGINKKKNAGYCECESWYAGTNPALEQSCKSSVRAKGEGFGTQAAFEATLSKDTLATQTQAGQATVAQQQQLQATQSQLLKDATTTANSGGNTTLYISIGIGVLLLAGAAVWKWMK